MWGEQGKGSGGGGQAEAAAGGRWEGPVLKEGVRRAAWKGWGVPWPKGLVGLEWVLGR